MTQGCATRDTLTGHGHQDDLILERWPTPTSSSSNGCEHRISPSRPDTTQNSSSYHPCRSDSLLQPCRPRLAGIVPCSPGSIRFSLTGAFDGSVGSGRESNLHFITPFYTFQTQWDRRLPPGRSPDLKVWFWGGHVPTPTPGSYS